MENQPKKAHVPNFDSIEYATFKAFAGKCVDSQAEKSEKCVLFAMKKSEKCVIAPHFENHGRRWRHCHLLKNDYQHV